MALSFLIVTIMTNKKFMIIPISGIKIKNNLPPTVTKFTTLYNDWAILWDHLFSVFTLLHWQMMVNNRLLLLSLFLLAVMVQWDTFSWNEPYRNIELLSFIIWIHFQMIFGLSYFFLCLSFFKIKMKMEKIVNGMMNTSKS